jgi:hypothetical protein
MNSKVTGCVWLVAGPLVSMLLGYGLFLFLAFVAGGGNYLDDSDTEFEKLMTRLSLPIWGLILVGGSVVSVIRGFLIFNKNGGQTVAMPADE